MNDKRFTSGVFRFIIASVWTILLLVLLLSPGDATETGGQPPPMQWDELIEGAGHLVLFAGFTALWLWAFTRYFSWKRACIFTIALAVLLGITTEYGQSFVHRDVTLLDLTANFLGILSVIIWISSRSNHNRPRRARHI